MCVWLSTSHDGHLTPDRGQNAENIARSLMLVTALNSRIGYDKAVKIGKLALAENITLKQAAEQLGYVRPEDFDRWVVPAAMSGAGCHAAGRRRLSGLVKRSFSLAGHRTSVALEQEFWAALMHIAAGRQQTLTALVAAADAERLDGRPLASALRVLALREFFPATLTLFLNHRLHCLTSNTAQAGKTP